MAVNIVGGLELAPVPEAVLECAAPYWAMCALGCISPSGREWGFVEVAGALISFMHQRGGLLTYRSELTDHDV
jgi:hypothetical protein